MTAEFLAYSKSRGNDLSTPAPEFAFPRLKAGDRWCLRAPRWQEALEANNAPRVVLRATHEGALTCVINYADIVPQVPIPVPLMMPYRHSGDPRCMPDEITGSPYRFEPSLLQRLGQFAKAIVQIVRARSILGIDDHQIGEYCRKLDAIAAARVQGR